MNWIFGNKLLNYFVINDTILSIEEITGGLLHKLYKVELISGKAFAVKCLNPMIMKRENALNNMINSEIVASKLKEVLPVVAAIERNGAHVHEIEGQYFMVFEWMEGRSVFPPEITKYHCAELGKLLGKMHSADINVHQIKKEEETFWGYDWDRLLEAAKEKKLNWLSEFEELVPQLMKWNSQLINAKRILAENLVISHRDLDPKNVMWNGDEPYIIDWEAAGYINPYQELIEVINYWTDDGKGRIQKTYFDALMNQYRKYVSTENVNWEEVLICSYDGMLGWLEYNIKRAVGIETGNEKEMALGNEQVVATMQEIRNHTAKLGCLKEWL